MNISHLKKLLLNFKKGSLDIDKAMEKLKALPFEEMGFATIDSHRSLRQGFPEVIFGEGKTKEQIVAIAKKMAEKKENILITRLDSKKAKAIKKNFPT
ncbi:MAG: 1-(5-phosphoribosyl)-5-amino-4-imidazole-carboxylate carboxylase, partial [Deltaproteobacteria bacterium]|nr:1-(5-phosphoribosyl)-5-amino-4-imidazole-carboxylate carboxylase [Deltaproteobacteria bacterium]